jgi:hypothetical protein
MGRMITSIQHKEPRAFGGVRCCSEGVAAAAGGSLHEEQELGQGTIR